MHDCENLKFAKEELKHLNSIIHDFDNAYNSCHKNLTDKHSTADSNKYSRKVNQLMIDLACEVSETRVLWDKNHKDYRKNSLQKKAFTPLVAKLK